MDKEYEIIVESRFAAELRDIVLESSDESTGEPSPESSVEERDIIVDPEGNIDKRNTRRVIRAKVVDHHDGSDRRVNFSLVHQRRHRRADPWQDVDTFKLSELHGGEAVKLSLDAAETWELFQILKDLYALSRSGEPSGERRVYLIRRDDAHEPEISLSDVISFLNNGGDAVWNDIVASKQNIPIALALHRIHEERMAALAEFELHMRDSDWDEGNWQEFFSRNRWIFGHGLAYHFLDIVQEQAHYGGQTLAGRGGQRGDFLTATRAEVKFTVLVEIKRPDTPLLKRNEYRNKVFGTSDELAGGVAQLQSNCRTWVIEGSRQEENQSMLEDIFTYEPKGILVIGCTTELSNDRNKRASFELFRRNLRNPEVLTFDELLERARFMVAREEAQTTARGSGTVESSDE